MIEWVDQETADRAGTKEELVLREQAPAHYPEFLNFLNSKLSQDHGNLFFRAPSGNIYVVRLVSDEVTPPRHEILILVRKGDDTEIGDENVNQELWPFLEWLLEGVGGEWTVNALRQTASIYRIPGAPQR